MPFEDHFSEAAADYRAHRPRYPGTLFDHLASVGPGTECALDCATGSGQAAIGLAERFGRVVATDASASQVRQAIEHPRVTYRVARAEATGLSEGSCDLVTVAQAAHWLDLDPFYVEVRRVLRPGGVLAMWCYGLARVDQSIDSTVRELHDEIVGPCWAPQRRFVDDRYRSLPFPFDEVETPAIAMSCTWTIDAYLAYLGTWSAVRNYRRERGTCPLDLIRPRLAEGWGDGRRSVTWPLGIRLGRVD